MAQIYNFSYTIVWGKRIKIICCLGWLSKTLFQKSVEARAGKVPAMQWEDLTLTLPWHPSTKPLWWGVLVILDAGEVDRRIPGTPWPARSERSMSWSQGETLVSRTKEVIFLRTSAKDDLVLNQHEHICIRTCTYTHKNIQTHTNTKWIGLEL